MSELAVYKRYPITVASGDGVWLTTKDGRRLIDFYGGHATALLGYRHPEICSVLAEQAETLFFQTNAVELDVRTRAAQRLAAFAPPGLDHVFFANSGAEANENALRLAFRVTGRTKVVAFTGGFHGRTAAAAACTDGSSRWYAFPRLPFDVEHIPIDDDDAAARAIDRDTAAVIFEPVQGMAGAVAFDTKTLEHIAARARQVGALLIADEVQCGVGRSGRPFAIEWSGIAVDLLTTAKGIAAGFPCAAVLTSGAIAASVELGTLGTTFGGGPLACAIVERVIDIVSRPGFLEHVRAMELRIRERCQVGPIESVQGRGLLLGLRSTLTAADVLPQLLSAGILAGGSADPHIVRLLPPLTIASEHVDRLASALEGIS